MQGPISVTEKEKLRPKTTLDRISVTEKEKLSPKHDAG
jgi:hypothetical protein